MLVFFLIIKGTDVLSIPSDLISVGHFHFGVTIKINQKKWPESVPEYHCVKDEIRRILANLFKFSPPAPPSPFKGEGLGGGPKRKFLYCQVIKKGKRSHIFLRV
jgi:hypothetical protein